MGGSYDDWTVQELKEALKERDLPVSGKKRELIERLESSPEEKTEFGLFIAGVVGSFVPVIGAMIVLTLIITFLVTGNPDQIEGFETGAFETHQYHKHGVAIDDDNFVYVTQQGGLFGKYSVIEDDDGTLSLKEEYTSSILSNVTHLFVDDNYLYAVKGSYIYMIEDSGHSFSVVASRRAYNDECGDCTGSGIVVSGDYAYVSITGGTMSSPRYDSVEVYDVSNDFQHMGSVHMRPADPNGVWDGQYGVSEGEGHIKGLATNDEYLYVLVNSCLEPESTVERYDGAIVHWENDEDTLGWFCKDHIYIWELETIESSQLDGAVPVDSSMSMRGFLWFKQWYSTIGANGDYVYLGDDGWGTGIVVVDFSDPNNPKKVHSYGRTIDEYPSGKYQGAGIAANDDFIVVSTAGEPKFKGGASIAGSGDGVYIGKIDGDDDGVPLGKDAFPDWKYVNSNWELCAFLVLIFGLPILISAGWSEITSQRTRKAEDQAEAEQSIATLKDTIDRLKSKGIDTTGLERIWLSIWPAMDFAASPSFQKAEKLARKAVTEANELESQYQAAAERVTELRAKIAEFKEKGINTDELERVLAECETEMEFSASPSFQKAEKLARQAVTEANELESQYQAAAERMTELKAKIAEFEEKGINTDELERVLAECEAEMGAATEGKE